jgi:guanylate cyclase
MRRFLDFMLSFGAFPGETGSQRARRRIIVAALWLATLITIPTVLSDLEAGFLWIAAANAVVIVLAPTLLLILNRFPNRFALIVNVMFGAAYLLGSLEPTLFGGLVESGVSALFPLIIVVGALVALGIRAATWWFGAFVLSVIYSVLIPNWVDPIYIVEDPTFDVAFNLIATGSVVFAVMIYFVRQRNRFQQESDDLLHNILPDEIATRLKSSSSMIADSYDSASVLFADIVDFTPMSADMPAEELVGFLNSVFSSFDGLVQEFGLEKITTVGDEYMVASGLPTRRPDPAQPIAELALRMRETLAQHKFDGHEVKMRIGVNSGPVVAGVIGTHKFAYDLWGDVVNTASRMESEGVAGAIQISEATQRLIEDDYVCHPRGTVQVKGKGEMATYLLIDRAVPDMSGVR